MDKSFDIIVTVYNTAPKYLSRCLDSIVSLEYDNFSLTIVDDCSTNIETISFLKGVKERYSDKGIEIEIIYSKSNGGVGQARNIGLKNSKKDLVWFIDSDDRISKPDALVIINQYWQKFPNIDILSFAITSYDDTDFDKPVLKHRKHTTCFPTPTSIENYVDGCKDKPGVWSKVYNRLFLLENNLMFSNKNIYGEDVYHMIITYSKSNNIMFVKDCLYDYFIHSNTLTTGRTAYKRALELLEFNKEGYEFIKNDHTFISDNFDKFFNVFFYVRCFDIFAQGKDNDKQSIALVKEKAEEFYQKLLKQKNS